MASETSPEAVSSVAWRIFGGGESPKTGVSSFELIETVTQKHVSSDKQPFVAATVRSWFAESGDYRSLKDEAKPEIARRILAGIDNPITERAVWAVAAIDADVMQQAMETLWTNSEIGSFKDALYETLSDASLHDQIMNPSRISGVTQEEVKRARVPWDAIEKESQLWTFHHLERFQAEIVIFGLYPAVARLVDLAVALEGGNARPTVERLEHPVLQARAIFRMQESGASSEGGGFLDWIARDSGDAAIAAAIFRVLRAAVNAEVERRHDEYTKGVEKDSTFGRGDADDQDDREGKALMEALVGRLAVLEATACALWIGEILGFSVRALGGGIKGAKPTVLAQLERACLSCVADLLVESASQGILDAFKAGLRRKSDYLWTGYLARVAWLIRDRSGELASEIARDAVVSYETQIEGAGIGGAVAGDWFSWKDRDWLEALGSAVALSSADLDYVKWVSDRCRRLPLSVWDAEERYQEFIRAEPLAQQWFFLAFLSMAPGRELGRTVRPDAVRSLAEALLRHSGFAGEHLYGDPEVSVPVEFAARMAVKFGEVDDGWILDWTGTHQIGPLALWALLDQRRIEHESKTDTNRRDDGIFEAEVTSRAAYRFGSENQSDPLALQYWGRLWLVLRAARQAEQAAMEIMSLPDRVRDRGCGILVLRLLALVARIRGLSREMGDQVGPLYNRLWPAYGSTTQAEQDDRREIEETFADSGLLRR